MNFKDIDGRISQTNGRLKASNVGVKVERVGDRLVLRATLPPKPDSTRKLGYQQRVYLGLHANPNGLKYAETEARKVGALLDCKEFDWQPYLKQTDKLLTIGDWIAKFEENYFASRARTPQTESTWSGDYAKVFKTLRHETDLEISILREAILNTEPDTKTRKRFCMVLGALAKFAGLELDTKSLAGKYSPKQVKPRDLPDDQLITETFYQIKDPAWRWVFGILATYGIRPHEVFHLNTEALPILEVLEGKTGGRKVWACFPEWIEEFDLKNCQLPQVTGANNTILGSKVSKAFNKLEIPFKPYDLRHCWAVRSIQFGLDISLAAQQMGHSAQVHTELYHAWISEKHHQRAYDLLMMRSDRPKPPSTTS